MEQVERYLVYGASGVQGGAVARLLVEKGLYVRTVTRSEEQAVVLNNQGIEAVIGDFSKAELLDQAHEGIDNVFLNIPVDFELAKVRKYISNAVDAARRANIKLLVVNTSVYVPEHETDAAAIEIKRELINYVKQSGVPFIIVQPIVYMENFLIPGLLNNHMLAYPVPADKPIAWISADDAAKYHVYALTHSHLAGSTLQATGPEALTGMQLAEHFSAALGEAISFYSLPLDSFETAIRPLLGKETASGLAGLYRWIEANTASLPQPDHINPTVDPSFRMTGMTEWISKAVERGHFSIK
ncbi:Uncharacterized conserved protein YbjT, contains NAD(P)-binding and DUF2867 domains [Paenibacillus algorifonticola]|uniref:Uncharacterized conserved protein YbjT, contains NAD(P)-binding and DUF2867 domains n=1 Tax=Paenibacillus algorifonticola TaxID=684063 RepID=A0A1I2D5B7_9BACL|nr:NmrA family NAD(P)-binding protein [Paenibacillus algorifonticola]SFE75263.1 Uncharacterized conserved protein YbjT, contains NAD(P)-binding and DUF2867 domains [Paenibacillus algorifonticola]